MAVERAVLNGALEGVFCVGRKCAMAANLARAPLRVGADLVAGFLQAIARPL